MARIKPALITKLKEKTGLSQTAIYERIKKKALESVLPRELAAILVGVDFGIPINRFATPEQINDLRHAHHPNPPASAQAHAPEALPALPRRATVPKKKQSPKKPQNTVWVIHGRDYPLRDSMFAFLRALGLNPIEWNQAVGLSKKGAPHVSTILDAAFKNAVASVVLLSPDDEAQLRRHLWKKHNEDLWEKKLTPQARPNVLFEAGMAFAYNERGTVLVQVGSIRPFSDVGGRHIVNLSNSFSSRQQLAIKLQNAGCTVDMTRSDWTDVGNFVPTTSKPKRRRQIKKKGITTASR